MREPWAGPFPWECINKASRVCPEVQSTRRGETPQRPVEGKLTWSSKHLTSHPVCWGCLHLCYFYFIFLPPKQLRLLSTVVINNRKLPRGQIETERPVPSLLLHSHSKQLVLSQSQGSWCRSSILLSVAGEVMESHRGLESWLQVPAWAVLTPQMTDAHQVCSGYRSFCLGDLNCLPL